MGVSFSRLCAHLCHAEHRIERKHLIIQYESLASSSNLS